MADITPDDITSRVNQHNDETLDLRERMEEDYDLYRLQTFKMDEGYEAYTSNNPRTFADKLNGWIVQASLQFRVPQGTSQEEERRDGSIKERFLVGAFAAADEVLTHQMLPPIRDQLAFFVNVRGMGVGRCMLLKEEDGSTTVDIQPWDPLHVYWETDKKGLKWICYKTKRTRQSIRSEYDDFEFDNEVDGAHDNYEYEDVYDYYDREQNGVVIDKQFARKMQPHGAKVVPAFIVVADYSPPIQTSFEAEPTVEDYAESIYAADRNIYNEFNFTMSHMKHLVRRSVKHPIVVQSQDGRKVLAEDPYVAGSEISLAQGETVQGLDLQSMAPDAAAFLGLVSGEEQRGSLSHVAYGDLQFQLSGFAIGQLRQGIESVLIPRIKAVERAYLHMAQLLTSQYMDGGFEALKVQGYNKRTYFDETIDPEALKELPPVQVRLRVKLPQDEAANIAMAVQLRQGENPLLDDVSIRDEWIDIEDVDLIEDKINAQRAKTAHPIAQIFTLMDGAAKVGDFETAQLYLQIFQQFMLQQQVALGQAQQAAQAAANPQPEPPPGPAGPGFPPEVLPQAAQGQPPPTPMGMNNMPPQGGF